MMRLFAYIVALSVTIILNSQFSLLKAGTTQFGSGLSHKYGIYFFSEEGTELDSLYGSYLQFRLKAGIGATYDYFISDSVRVEGRVESYDEAPNERRYVLDRFFDSRHNALLRIIDMPTCDNLKVAVIQYANEKEDTTGVFLQYILTDDAF